MVEMLVGVEASENVTLESSGCDTRQVTSASGEHISVKRVKWTERKRRKKRKKQSV
jgi:hypothetical protein